MTTCHTHPSSLPNALAEGPNNNNICAFCKRNRESVQMYSSHQLRDQLGRVTCPMLRKYVCAGCGATGDNAHTRSYCPNVISARQQRELGQQRRKLEATAASQPLAPPAAAAAAVVCERPPARGADIQLGSNRAFNNMSRVTNSLYNSAGRLRNRHESRSQPPQPRPHQFWYTERIGQPAAGQANNRLAIDGGCRPFVFERKEFVWR